MRFLIALLIGLWPIAACSGLADVVERVTPSVVVIRLGAGMCTGVALDKRRIVTAKHCIPGDQKDFELTLSDGTGIAARLIGVHEKIDIAVLRTTAPVLSWAQVGDARAMRAGDPLFAIGHPLGYRFTVTSGIVSFVDRDDGDPSGLHIQTDTSINPGNSGGPLFDSGGKLIGIVVSGVGMRGGSIGLNFAIPIHTVLLAIEEIG